MSKTLAEAADDLTSARRAFLDVLARTFGLYRVVDWMMRRWLPR
jgi:hypothetical protein